jgi:hypothetical protein
VNGVEVLLTRRLCTTPLTATGISEAFPTCTRRLAELDEPTPNDAGFPPSPENREKGSGRLLVGVAVSTVASVAVPFRRYCTGAGETLKDPVTGTAKEFGSPSST